MGTKEDAAILRGMLNILNKQGRDCLLVKAAVTTKRGRKIDRSFIIYRKGDHIRFVPDTLGPSTSKESAEVPGRLWSKDQFDLVHWIFEGELGSGRKVHISRMDIRRITDTEVQGIISKLPSDQQTNIIEGE